MRQFDFRHPLELADRLTIIGIEFALGSIDTRNCGMAKKGPRKKLPKEVAVINLDVSAVGLKNGIDAELLGQDASAENITVYLEKSTLGKWKIVEVEGIDKNFDY